MDESMDGRMNGWMDDRQLDGWYPFFMGIPSLRQPNKNLGVRGNEVRG